MEGCDQGEEKAEWRGGETGEGKKGVRLGEGGSVPNELFGSCGFEGSDR